MIMKIEEKLKQELTKIKESNWIIRHGVDAYELCIKMMDNIGSLDSNLRDNLILNMFDRIIEGRKISYDQMKEILRLCLSEEHLFWGIGKVKDDSVFNRTFSMLIIEIILCVNNKNEKEFLCEEEVLGVYKKVMDYFRKENDLRGYVEGKGWAHSTAHTSDALSALVESRYLKYEEHKAILDMIKEKTCVSTYTYINEEDERLINTFMRVYNRKNISTDEIINWLYSFKDINANGKYPDEEHLRENRKVFFRSLYFRVKKFNVEESIIKAIENVLDSIPAFY